MVQREAALAQATCPSCRQAVTISPEHVGVALECPWCGKPFRASGPKPAPAVPPVRTAPRQPILPPSVPPVQPPVQPPVMAPVQSPVYVPPQQPVHTPAPAYVAAGPQIPADGPVVQRHCPQCDAELPVGHSRCVECGTSYRRALRTREKIHRAQSTSPETPAWNMGVVGGLLMIVVAGVWFYLGWRAGYIYFYPPILALIGIGAIINGMSEGNYAGGGRRVAHRSARRRGGSRRVYRRR